MRAFDGAMAVNVWRSKSDQQSLRDAGAGGSNPLTPTISFAFS
jgi:hypothetical protein